MNRTLQLRTWLALGASSAALLAGAPALAQGGASNTSSSIQEIVVTAEKRSVTLQSVPVAVTAFTSKERALVGINSVQDMTNFTPGLTYSSQLDRPVMRGLARSTNIYAADSSVGVYDNDLFTNSTFLVGRDDMIVDQVEILLGPQNTLYGRNAIGGVINTQSKHPTDIWTGEVRAGFGNYNYNKLEATISGPLDMIAPGLSFRLSGYNVDQDKGYFKNLQGDSIGEVHHDPYFELQLKYSSDHDDLWLMMYNLRFNGDRGGPGGLLGTPSTGPYDTSLVDSNDTLFFNPNFAYSGLAVPGSVVAPGPGSNPTTLKNRITNLSQGTKINVDGAYSFNFHWIHHFDGVDVKYVGGYSQYHYSLSDNDWVSGESGVRSYQIPTLTAAQFSPLAGNFCGYLNAVGSTCAPLTVQGNQGFTFETQTDWYSHEINFSSTSNSKLSWIAGAYYYNETDNNPETEFSKQQSQLTKAGWNVIPVAEASTLIPTLFSGGTPAKSVYNPSQAGDYLLLDYQDRIETEAVFGQVDYKLTDQLKLTAGLRYTYDHKTAQEETKYYQLANPTLALLLGQYTPVLDITPLLTSYAPGKGVKSGVSFPTTGPWAGDAVRQLGDNSSAVTGTFGVEWTPDPVSLYYARYNRGYKAFALNAGYVGANPEAAPEHVNDYELGFKKTFAKVFQLDVDAFYYDYSNDQLPLAFPVATPAGSLALTQFVNIPKAVSDGVEFTAVWNPIRHLNLSLTYGFDHTEILTGCAKFTTPLAQAAGGCFIDPADPFAQAKGAKAAGPATSSATEYYNYNQGNIFADLTPVTAKQVFQSVKGNALPQAPENKIAFNANYTWEFDPGKLTLSGSYIWKDQSYSSIFTRTQYDYAPSWSQVDLRATWSGNHDRYEVVLYVKNLFNTIGYDAAAAGYYNGTPQGGGSPTYTNSYDITPPRLFGAEVHYKF